MTDVHEIRHRNCETEYLGRKGSVGERKTREGVVLSDKMQKTRVVLVERVYRHPRYQRVIRQTRKVKAHDEANESRVGDRVLIEETRPLSREKRWRIRQVLERAAAV
jgi:small subunit ribosomal protein S17